MSDIKKAIVNKNGFKSVVKKNQYKEKRKYTTLVANSAYIHRKNRRIKHKLFGFSELTNSTTYGQNINVGGIHQQIAKFWDWYSLAWRQHRHYLHGGFFSSIVECEYGFMPGIRRIQHGENRNTRMVFQESHTSTRQLLLTGKTQLGVVVMTAISHPMGNHARSSSAYLPSVPTAPIRRAPKPAKAPRITYQANPNGLIFYRNKYPVAWLCAGHHHIQPPNQAKTVQFVDVAYYRVTEQGANMETAFFDTMPQAIAFVVEALKVEGGAA